MDNVQDSFASVSPPVAPFHRFGCRFLETLGERGPSQNLGAALTTLASFREANRHANARALRVTSMKPFAARHTSEEPTEWHRWFARYPVIITSADEPAQKVWLQFVERKWKTNKLTGRGKWHYRRAAPLTQPDTEVLALPEKTIDDLMAKARVVRWHYSKLWNVPAENNELNHRAIRNLIEAVEQLRIRNSKPGNVTKPDDLGAKESPGRRTILRGCSSGMNSAWPTEHG